MSETLDLGSALEQQIIAHCIDDPEFYAEVGEWLRPIHFVDEDLAKLYAVIRKHVEKFNAVPTVHILDHYARELGIDLSTFDLKPDKTAKEWLLDQTIAKIRRQELKRFIFEAVDQLNNDNLNYAQLEERLKQVLAIQNTGELGLDYFDVERRLNRILSMDTTKIPTGIESIDQVLGGGVTRKELMCIGANTGIGKSLLMAIVAAHALQEGYKVLYYSLEMSEEWVSLRIDSALLGLTKDELLGDVETLKAGIHKLRRILDGQLIIKEFPTKTASANTLRAHLKKLRERKRFVPDLIIVDYGDIMRANNEYRSRYEEQGAIFQELRGLAQEYNVPIVTGTQMNRGAREKDIATTEDIGDSYDKARIMDSFFVILQKPHEKLAGYFRIYDAKVRNGISGQIHGYEVDYARVKIRYVGPVQEGQEHVPEVDGEDPEVL